MTMNRHYVHMFTMLNHTEALQTAADNLYWELSKLGQMLSKHAGDIVGRCGDVRIDREPLMTKEICGVPRQLMDKLRDVHKELQIVRNDIRHRMEVDEVHYKIVLEDYAKLMNAAAQPKT